MLIECIHNSSQTQIVNFCQAYAKCLLKDVSMSGSKFYKAVTEGGVDPTTLGSIISDKENRRHLRQLPVDTDLVLYDKECLAMRTAYRVVCEKYWHNSYYMRDTAELMVHPDMIELSGIDPKEIAKEFLTC